MLEFVVKAIGSVGGLYLVGLLSSTMVGSRCVGGDMVTLVANWSNGVLVLLLPPLAYMCPLTFALEVGGYMCSIFVVNVGKVMRNPALIVFSRVIIVGEKRDAW